MIANKYVLMLMSLVTAVLGWASAFDWVSLSGARTGGAIVGAIGVIKLVLNMLAPAPGATVKPTDNVMITHKVQS